VRRRRSEYGGGLNAAVVVASFPCDTFWQIVSVWVSGFLLFYFYLKG
jgi:hypothetical protein